LRQAILDAEAAAGANTITWVGGAGTITLLSALPPITQDTTFNASGAAGTVTIDGAGTFATIVVNSGTTTVIGSIAETTYVYVNGGRLDVNGTLTSSAGSVGLVVNAGATLGGAGTYDGSASALGGASVSGTVAPGASIGTLTIVGGFSQNVGSTYAVEVAPLTGAGPGVDNDHLSISGAATIDPISTSVSVSAAAGTYTPGTYTILTAAGGVTGTYGSVTPAGVSPALVWSLAYDATNVFLVLSADFSGVAGLTRNQQAVAAYIDAVYPSATGDLLSALHIVANLSTAAQIADALGKLHPEVYDAFNQIGFDNMHRMSGFLQNRFDEIRGGRRSGADLAGLMSIPEFGGEPERWNDLWGSNDAPFESNESAPTEWNLLQSGRKDAAEWGGFLRAVGSFSDEDSDSDHVGFDARSYGAALGVDYRFDARWVGGLAVGYLNTDAAFDLGRGDTDVHSFYVSPYVSFRSERWQVDAAFIYGHHWYDTTRNIVVAGFPATRARGDHEADAYSIFADVGYMFEPGGGWRIGPVGSLQWAHVDQESFTEADAFGVNLEISSRDNDSFRSALGVRATRPFKIGTGSFVPSAELRWGHEFADDHRDITARFVGIPGTFSVKSDGPVRDRLIFRVGAVANMIGGWNVAVRYDYEGDMDEVGAHTLTAGVGWEF
jgi:uncharacterized protein with beta-barrel porin domain